MNNETHASITYRRREREVIVFHDCPITSLTRLFSQTLT